MSHDQLISDDLTPTFHLLTPSFLLPSSSLFPLLPTAGRWWSVDNRDRDVTLTGARDAEVLFLYFTCFPVLTNTI